MSTSTAPTEADIIFSRASVAFAKSQRLIASWLPPRTEDELRATKTDEEIEREEQELFAPVPELLGLGAPLPQEIPPGDPRRTQLASNARLRKQLLGQELARLYGAGKRGAGGLPVGSKPRPVEAPRARHEDEDDENEEGRSSLGKAKRAHPAMEELDSGRGASEEGGSGIAGRAAKRTASYLDEVLAEKEQKKRRRKKKKQRTEGEGA